MLRKPIFTAQRGEFVWLKPALAFGVVVICIALALPRLQVEQAPIARQFSPKQLTKPELSPAHPEITLAGQEPPDSPDRDVPARQINIANVRQAVNSIILDLSRPKRIQSGTTPSFRIPARPQTLRQPISRVGHS
jgi:hypothetical protein